MNLTDTQCKEIVYQLWKLGKEPAAKINADWNSLSGRIGQYSHMIQYGSSKPRKFNSWELQRKLGDYDVIIEFDIPGQDGWSGWIPGKKEYSTDLDEVAKECTYASGTSINIWKIPATIIRKLEKETKMESTITLKQLKHLVKEANEDKPQYKIQYIECRLTKDDYKEGEDTSTSTYYDIDAPNKSFDSIEKALEYVNTHYINEKWDKENWFYNEDGRFYSDYLVTKNEEKASESDIEKWRRGAMELYNLNVDVKINKCTLVSLEDAKAEGFDY